MATELQRELERAGTTALLEAAKLVQEAAERDIPKGDPQLDPDPGFALREHVHIEIAPDGRSVRIVADGPYAAKLHEDLHMEHPRGGKAKFLESNVLGIVPHLEGIFASEVRKRFVKYDHRKR